MATQNTDTRTSDIKLFEIYSNKGGKVVDLSGGITDLRYYESVLSNNVSMSVHIIDTGHESDGNSGTKPSKGVLDDLPIRGGEQTVIKIVDAKDNPTELSFKGDTSLYVNRIRASKPNVNQDSFALDFASRELFANEQSRVVKRYDGKISDNVNLILTDPEILGTTKNINVDATLVDYNFIGNDRKPFYVCTWLASKSVPAGKGELGAAAGYFFYETYDGFNFKSIDGLFDQEYKKKYIFNDTADTTEEGYEKIHSYTIDRDIDLHQNLVFGTYANRSLFFDFYAMDYKIREYSYDENQKGKIINAGVDDIDSVADEFRTPVSRLMSHVLDVGTLPSGKDMGSQLSNWKSSPSDPTYDATNTMVQSIMRYNQMFTIKINIIIAGDFSLRAGDLIYCEFPQTTGDPNKEVNRQSGGIYMISSLCHRITPSDTFSSLTLVRDSFGRKPF